MSAIGGPSEGHRRANGSGAPGSGAPGTELEEPPSPLSPNPNQEDLGLNFRKVAWSCCSKSAPIDSLNCAGQGGDVWGASSGYWVAWYHLV